MTNSLILIKNFFLDSLFPKRCVGCSKFGQFLCAECASKIELLSTSICYECGRITKDHKFCSACRQRRGYVLSGIIVAAKYESPVKEMISGLKYQGYQELSSHLGELLVQSLLNSKINLDSSVAIPVPLHPSRKRVRGFNQGELMARYVSKKLGIAGGDVLEKRRKTVPQVGLTREKRLVNVADTFICVDPELVKGKNVLLIDDVATTGATLNECAKVLKSAGAKSVIGVVVARHVN